LMCGILLFARLIDVLDRDDPPERISQSVAPTSPHVQEAARLAATEVASQQPAQPDVLHLDPSAQNSSHAIVPKTEQPAASASPATETKSPAAADPIEVSPTQAPKDEFVMLTATATIRNGPSDSASRPRFGKFRMGRFQRFGAIGSYRGGSKRGNYGRCT
jgi:hypothetical protein